MLSPRLAGPLVAVVAAAAAPAALAAAPGIHAHRGGTVLNGKPRYAEESTRAYRNAARNGFVLEVDAKLTEDGVPVAIHDATLDRTTNCTGEVRTFTYLELDGCRTDVLGSPGSPLPTRPARRTEPIPRIADVLELARQTGAEVNLEIKNVPTDPTTTRRRPSRTGSWTRCVASGSRAGSSSSRASSRRTWTWPASGCQASNQPARGAVPQRALPPGGRRQRLRLHLSRMARYGRLRPPRARPRPGRGAVHAGRGRGRPCREERGRRRCDHRRRADGRPCARHAAGSCLRAPARSSRGGG